MSAAGDEPGRHALEPWALELLRSARVGHFGTAGADGRPLVVPVCYALIESTDGLRVVTAIDAKPKGTRRLRRLRNIEENPRATLLVDIWDEDWACLRWVMVEGEARVLEGGQAGARAVRAEALRTLEAKYPQYLKLPLDIETTPVVALAVSRVRAWRFDGGAAQGQPARM